MLITVALTLVFFLLRPTSCRTVRNEARSRRPWIIAHRGSSGVYPEHTVAAYRQAILDRADFVECDVLPTRDRRLVCLHDPYLSSVTDVAEHPEFADRKRKLTLPGYGERDDWFSFDFTLAELKSLRVRQRFPFRDQSHNALYRISTFDEYIATVKESARPVGIYPELKHPELVNRQPFMAGSRFEDLLLDALDRHGYRTKSDLCLIQSFSDSALRYLSNRTELRLVVLVWRNEDVLGPFQNESRIEEWSALYHGVGAWKTQLVQYFDEANEYKNWITNETDFLRHIRRSGLKLHLYTFRNEDRFLAWDFKQDPVDEYLYFSRLGDIEGMFTDFPHTMFRAFEKRYEANICTKSMANRVTSLTVIRVIFVVITSTFGTI